MMKIMYKHIKGYTYNEYLNTASEEEAIIIKEFETQGVLSHANLEKIKEIDENLRILVITSTACKDSATIIPILNKLLQLNDKIKVEFLLKRENELLLEKLSNEQKVPTIMILDENENVIRKFVEFPRGVKDILIKTSHDNTEEIIDNMRKGMYNQLVQEDLIKLLTGDNYKYISFQRKDK